MSLGLKKLIRSKATGSFLTKDGAWTADMAEASNFAGGAATTEARTKFQLVDCEIYYAFEDRSVSQYDFTIPLS